MDYMKMDSNEVSEEMLESVTGGAGVPPWNIITFSFTTGKIAYDYFKKLGQKYANWEQGKKN